jgi:DNA (cytosine-5)-methyltransferase 1
MNKDIGLTNSLEDSISDLLRKNKTISLDTNSFMTYFKYYNLMAKVIFKKNVLLKSII